LSNLDEISQYVNQLPFDLKAEMLVAVLAEHRVDPGEILASFDGNLKRAWSRDIASSSVEHLETGDNLLSIHLNRDGIYDGLPELLFHSDPGNEDLSGEEMAKNSMKVRAEEKEARMFFQPFENEIFIQRVQLAMLENRIFNEINAEFLMGIIPHFWRVDNDLPENYVSRLKKLLPLVHQIAGDHSLTAQCLEFILKEHVTISTIEDNSDEIAPGDFHYSGVIGKSLLGVDTISGNFVNGFIGHLISSIGPIMNPETTELVKNGRMNRFLVCFYSYFIPFELDIETKFIFEAERSLFMLNDNDDAEISYLGYNTVIQ